ncbi:MAG: serine/threonine-protein kinase [Polyangiaceae bacterium]
MNDAASRQDEDVDLDFDEARESRPSASDSPALEVRATLLSDASVEAAEASGPRRSDRPAAPASESEPAADASPAAPVEAATEPTANVTTSVDAGRTGARRYCPQCAEFTPTLNGGICARCRSLVIAQTLPLGTRDQERFPSVNGAVSATSDDDEFDLASGNRLRADPLIGVVVAERYRIVEPLGRGGMGIVYKVEHVRIGKLLAMKLLAGELSRNQEVVRRFKTEALTASRLSSPNTVQVFDYGVSEGLTYLVMELVSGDDLGRILKTHGLLPASRVGRIVVQIANSLAEAHGHGIVHRDIKPENVMILKARDGTDLAKVLDFGLAKLREGPELSELTSQGAIVGTPYFMSPEQIRGDPVDARSDIYSLGALMYRALTGIYPFSGPSPMSVFAKHLTELPQVPCELNPSISRGMSDIVLRALEKDPAGRFQRIEDLQAAVMSELSELGTSGIETLLDSGALRRLEKPQQAAAAEEVVATRNEVESYERKLRRTRVGITMLLATLPLAAIGAGAHYALKQRPVPYAGVESEPNNTPAQANTVPYGKTMRAMLGKRLSDTQSDVDFFAVEVPQDARASRLTVTALPNIPLCTQVFSKGQTAPLAQYCTGKPGFDLEVTALKLPPGPYFLTVMQDLDARGEGKSPFIHENVSDEYAVSFGPADDDPTFEVEPNDAVAGATPVGVGATVRGLLAWVADEDVICPKVESTGMFRFRIEDDVREAGSVLSASLVTNGVRGHPVRIHGDHDHKTTATDVPAPYSGFTFQGIGAPCLVLKATVDPSTSVSPDAVPRGSRSQYRVSLEPVP